jgi:hypothetical protein
MSVLTRVAPTVFGEVELCADHVTEAFNSRFNALTLQRGEALCVIRLPRRSLGEGGWFIRTEQNSSSIISNSCKAMLTSQLLHQ